jgi:hypothetical protein
VEAAEAIALVTEFILWRNLDYPIEGLQAERFASGWSVHAAAIVDERNPMEFLERPGERAEFLVDDSGHIQEVPSLVSPQQAQAEFTAEELAHDIESGSENPDATRRFIIADTALPEAEALTDDAVIEWEAARLIESIARDLAELGPAGWEEFSAEFAFTVSSQVSRLRFGSDDHKGVVPVPQSIVDLVRRQRGLAAETPAGPWWRLLLTVNNRGAVTVDYDYGDNPFPADQLVAREHYRNDLQAYPRPLPAWLAAYIGGE